MDDRTTREPDPKKLGEVLGWWRGARPPVPDGRDVRQYPVPPFENDPVEGHPLDRLLERLRFQQKMNEFQERRAFEGRRGA